MQHHIEFAQTHYAPIPYFEHYSNFTSPVTDLADDASEQSRPGEAYYFVEMTLSQTQPTSFSGLSYI